MKKIWKVRETSPRLQRALSEVLGLTPLFAQLLVNRGIKTPEKAQAFLFGGLADCSDPFLLKDMDCAVTRIKTAIEKKDKILIYGDYDVDGVTSTALLADVFFELDAKYETFIPNRLEEGYGLNMNAVALAADNGVKLLITVDCGINSADEVAFAKTRGIDVIITDHHEVKESWRRPDACAVVDPHQSDCPYPFKYLAGVGVAYKLARALMKGSEHIADRHLDLVALGTIADVAPLNGENRILVRCGLRTLRKTEKLGLKALADVAGVEQRKLNAKHVGFALGPRINAMGRVGSANTALELMMCDDPTEAVRIARLLNSENKKRQVIEKDIFKEAAARVRKEVDLEKTKIIVLADDAWHVGVIGIVASRLAEEFLKPTILIVTKDGKGKGSGRGVEGFNLFEAINRASAYLVDFGGHEAACGIRIMTENVALFTEKLNTVAEECFAPEDKPAPEMEIDLQLPFSHVGKKLVRELNLLTPYGPGNAEPVFSTGDIEVKNVPRDIGRSGFKFLVTCGNLTCEALTFRKNSVTRPKKGDVIDLAYTPSVNSWNGVDTIQMNIHDLRIAE